MPAAVASRAREAKLPRNRDSAPPAKKARLAQSPATARQNGLKALVNGTSSQKPTAKTKGLKDARKAKVDESSAVVGGGQAGHGDVDMADADKETIVISSGEEESDDDISADQNQGAEAGAQEDEAAPAVNGHADEANDVAQDGAVDDEELSFGDRLRAQDPGPLRESRIVDVEAAFDEPTESQALAAATNSRPLAAPNASSLGTVLTQALRTNDVELLNSCLQVMDVDTIYATVERLPSPLVGKLVQKLAERLHKKPGRAGMLMVWVQWALAAHGGYLASQPQLVAQFATLNRVLKQRSSGLQPLLALKGRLDMLQAQQELRKKNQKANDDEDEAVIYVEGEDDYVSSVEGDDVSVDGDKASSGLKKRLRDEFDDAEESSMDEMPTMMEGYEDSEEGSEDSDNLLDDEAEETDDDLGDGMSEPMSDDMEEGEGLSESEEESKPARRSTAARAGLKSRR
ncbi:U3 small nucleolar RNA-associated protein-like protein 5 [Plenodomus tracheiphilus IPT5]|uniref:U3 small nucleolar RNA-associated protein-like protein 5 n=1 Tax=Plenodomus tracheiphilus IPT5 TaxID=1408161 RepID=A0A6A7AYR8_9PLEO|nr:U3 small nucleolar RNA-associated protein-like protein 5 [Plenodomus tracheiphilus IPT5]